MKPLILFLLLCFYSVDSALDTEWWKHTTFYEIIPLTFKDSDGDGIGDLQGIISKLDHLKEIGVGAVHLTPPYPTNYGDMGYDIINYKDIDHRYGSLEDFDQLIQEMKERDLKLIMDLVINHSDKKHEWFQKSVQMIDPYTDFYVWKDSRGVDPRTHQKLPPNNWINIFSGQPGSGWTWNEERQQFYFHQFTENQADLNLRYGPVKEEIKNIMKFWLDRGVAGFRMDAVIFFMEDENLNEGVMEEVQLNRDESVEFVHELRKFVDDYSEKKGDFERVMIAEAHSSPANVLKYYDRGNYHITHFPYVFFLRYIDSEVTAVRYSSIIESWINVLPPNAISLWMTQDHDGSRVSSRIRPEYDGILTITAMLLPGSVGCYYGQEIGMDNGHITKDQINDHSGGGSRDPARLAMQWDDSLHAGFSENHKSFVPTNTDYVFRNVKLQKSQAISHLNLFKDLSDLRRTNISKYGDFKSFVVSEYVYSFIRTFKNRVYIVVINFYYSHLRVNLNKINYVQNPITVVASSTNSEHKKGDILHKGSEDFTMRPYSAMVLDAAYHNENDEDIDIIYEY